MPLTEKLSQMGDCLLSSFQKINSTTKNNVPQCLPLWEGKAHCELWSDLFSCCPYSEPTEADWTFSSQLDFSRVSIAREGTDVLCLFWGHFKALISAVCANGNCLGQRLQTNCKESARKNFQCRKNKFGNQPFQAIKWRMEGQKGPHSSLYTIIFLLLTIQQQSYQSDSLPIQN